jgi:hypothetical protein
MSTNHESIAKSLAELLEEMTCVVEKVDRLEKATQLAVEKETYTVEEAAGRLNRAPWAVRQWCNLGQAKATKVGGRGRRGEWRITHEELTRLQNEGAKPLRAVTQTAS